LYINTTTTLPKFPMDAASYQTITTNPLLRSILRFLVDEKEFNDMDTEDDVMFKMVHSDKTICWHIPEGSDSKLCAQLNLWSNTHDSCWVIYADLYVDMQTPSAITLKLDFDPNPIRQTNERQTRTFEETISTEDAWTRIQTDIIEEWIKEGLEVEEEMEERISEDNTDQEEGGNANEAAGMAEEDTDEEEDS
jgi:hypothetical protein